MATAGLVNGSRGERRLSHDVSVPLPGLELGPSIQFVADFLDLSADVTSPFCLFQPTV